MIGGVPSTLQVSPLHPQNSPSLRHSYFHLDRLQGWHPCRLEVFDIDKSRLPNRACTARKSPKRKKQPTQLPFNRSMITLQVGWPVLQPLEGTDPKTTCGPHIC